MSYTSFIETVLQEASAIASDKFGRVSGTSKGNDNNQVLTEADLAIGTHIINRLHEHYPDHNVIDEETGVIDHHSGYTWVIDPIDGTSNFAQGIPTYGIMLGLLKDDYPIAGGISLPFFQDTYTAERGSGAFCNKTQIHATLEPDLLNTLVAYTIDGHQEKPELTRVEAKVIGELVLGVRNFRASGSCFDVVMVAQGKYGAYLNQSSKIWDNIAAHIILEEAGCLYTDFMGNTISYANPLTKANDNFTFCTAPPHLHSQLQQIIHKHS